jgi:hypothetical protein
LAIRYQDLETQNHALLKDVDILKTTLRDSEARLNEFYSDQARMEDELAAQQAIIDKLREQTKELERDKRDISRRYSEQVRQLFNIYCGCGLMFTIRLPRLKRNGKRSTTMNST